jgi:hypothetical protein
MFENEGRSWTIESDGSVAFMYVLRLSEATLKIKSTNCADLEFTEGSCFKVFILALKTVNKPSDRKYCSSGADDISLGSVTSKSLKTNQSIDFILDTLPEVSR